MDAERNVRSVDELTLEIKRLLEGGFRRVWVEGEVVSCRPASSGHVYFTLKGREASLSAVIWKTTAARMQRAIRDGDRVTCRGDVEVYAPQGKYQLIVSEVKLGGEGALLVALERLKQKLLAEGLFDVARKRTLPYLPRRIGVVTSPTGAAIRDIVRSIHARFPVPILLAPAIVQGDGAPASLLAALEAVASIDDVDVVIIGRGGGSLEDLWGFNDERLARAIAACPKPVISAVGHEIDTMISDFVADVRAPTPTYAGQMAVPVYLDLVETLRGSELRLANGLRTTVKHARSRLTLTSARLSDPRRLIRERWQRVDDLDGRLRTAVLGRLRVQRTRVDTLTTRLGNAHPRLRLARESERLRALEARLTRAMRAVLQRATGALAADSDKLAVLSPVASLERGYAIVRKGPRVVRSSEDVAVGDDLRILVAHGFIDASVTRADSREESVR